MRDLSNFTAAQQNLINEGIARGETTIYLGECEVTGMARYYVVNFW